MNTVIKESCVETLREALTAQKNGADRIELCSRIDLDGLTPSRELIRNVVSELTIPIKVMIRPRDGDFIYSDLELDQMKDDILFCRSVKVTGVVFGVLNEARTIDIESTKILSDVAGEIDITFHKAIDHVSSIFNELDKLIKISKVTSVLTSGGSTNALSGSEIIGNMIERTKGSLTIIPAGSITEKNLKSIHSIIGASEYHGRKIVSIS